MLVLRAGLKSSYGSLFLIGVFMYGGGYVMSYKMVCAVSRGALFVYYGFSSKSVMCCG